MTSKKFGEEMANRYVNPLINENEKKIEEEKNDENNNN